MASVSKSPWALHGEPIIVRLTEMFNAGVSTSRIAATLCLEFNCSITRNAVIGKANRLGLTSPNGAGIEDYNKKRQTKQAISRRAREFRPKTVAASPLPEAPVTAAIPRHVSLMDLKHGECRYPFGDGPFTFCGCGVFGGSSYCAPHMVLCAKPKHGSEGHDREHFGAVMRRRRLPAVIAIVTAAEEAA